MFLDSPSRLVTDVKRICWSGGERAAGILRQGSLVAVRNIKYKYAGLNKLVFYLFSVSSGAVQRETARHTGFCRNGTRASYLTRANSSRRFQGLGDDERRLNLEYKTESTTDYEYRVYE